MHCTTLIEFTIFTQMEDDSKSKMTHYPSKKHVYTKKVILCICFIQLSQANM